jgi:hypothetical protein
MKTENANVKKGLRNDLTETKKRNSKKITDTLLDEIDNKNPIPEIEEKKIPEHTVRDISREPSILDDLGYFEKRKLKEKELEDQRQKDILQNKIYGWDEPFINEIMEKFNNRLNEEGKLFTTIAEKSANKEEEEIDTDTHLYLKLVLEDKERALFKELLLTTTNYPISVSIGDYDFFFENFDDEGKDPIFSFDKISFDFYFSSKIENLKNYLIKNKVKFGFKYSNKITFENLEIEVMSKGKAKTDKIKEEIKVETKVEPQKEVVFEKTKEINTDLKRTYKVRLVSKTENFFVVTDNPSDIYNNFSVEDVISIKLVGQGLSL